jgi:hypothetical protein
MLIRFIALLLLAIQALAVAPSGPWDQFNFAPKNRTSHPITIRSTQGNVSNAQDLLGSGSATLTGSGSFIVVDFGQEVILCCVETIYPVTKVWTGWRPSLSERR